MSLTIALDLEGTIADVHGSYFEDFNKEHGTNYKPGNIEGWDFEGIEHSDINVGKYIEETMEKWKEDHGEIKPIEAGSDRYVREISDEHTIDIVTERLECDESLRDWLESYGLEQERDYRKLIVTEDKSQLKKEYDIYVDDNPNIDADNIIIFHRPYNSRANFPIRIFSLAELPVMFNNYEDEVRKLMDRSI